MRGWDARARIHAGLVGLNALALGALEDGWVRAGAWGLAALGGGLILRSLRSLASKPPLFISGIPRAKGQVYFGRGYEWTVEESQEVLDSGVPGPRAEGDLRLPDRVLDQHVLIVGSTGVGKTRLMELLALQAVARGDAVVVIDPKGDEGLRRRVAEAAGPRFRLFSLPHPERSVRYNPVGRYRDVREVADRVAALLPSSGDALPFRNFGWEIIHTAARELHGKKPMTLQNLKRFALDRPVKPLADRPREHFLKMASALIPVLSKLSLDTLSPERGGLTWEEVDQRRQVVYFDLASLLGQESASAVAKMTTLDLKAYVGSRYAYAKGNGTMWLFVDELGDVVTGDLVGLFNKSRGAGLRVVGCAQTLADLEAGLGSRAAALQLLGNASTTVQFRALSEADAELFSSMAGQRLIRSRSEAASYEPALLGSGFKTVDDYRARFAETFDWRERPLVPAWLLGQLPVFHYYARSEGRVFRGRVPLLS